jgi:competence protein CoiA
MRFALVDGQRRTAEPGQRAQCPQCDAEVIAKCGPLVTWHWAHKVLDCDPWSEPMTQWHLDWQSRYPTDMCEVTIGQHRADVCSADRVIEFQHSAIGADEIRERERFYGRMVWVFDAVDARLDERLLIRPGKPRPGKRDNPRYASFRWKHPRKSIRAAWCPVYLDLGHGWLLQVRRHIGEHPPYGGWGLLVSHDEFVASTLPLLTSAGTGSAKRGEQP